MITNAKRLRHRITVILDQKVLQPSNIAHLTETISRLETVFRRMTLCFYLFAYLLSNT